MPKLSFLFVALIFMSFPFAIQGGESVESKPTVYGVLMYADWCGSCKALDPKITQARKQADLDKRDILFVRWDLTDETSQHQAKLMASVMGLSELYEMNAGKTGFMLLVHAKSGKKLAQLTQSLEPEDIAKQIQMSIQTATES